MKSSLCCMVRSAWWYITQVSLLYFASCCGLHFVSSSFVTSAIKMLFSSLFRQSVLALCATTAITAAPSGSLINPKADSNAKALMAYLLKLYNSKQVLSGQQDPTSTAWVTSNIGKTPAITGFDMMDYSPSRVAYGSKSTSVEDALSWANRGGIVAFVWHWVLSSNISLTIFH